MVTRLEIDVAGRSGQRLQAAGQAIDAQCVGDGTDSTKRRPPRQRACVVRQAYRINALGRRCPQRLRKNSGSANKLGASRCIEQRSFEIRDEDAVLFLGSDLEGFLGLLNHRESATRELLAAGRLRERNLDRARGVREEIELIQRRSVPDAMSNMTEAGSDRQQNVFGGGRRAERADLSDCIVPATNAVE